MATGIQRSGNGEFLEYTFPFSVRIARYSFTTSTSGTLPVQWTISGKVGDTWIPIQTTFMRQPFTLIINNVDVNFISQNGETFDTTTIRENRFYSFETELVDITGVRITVYASSGDSVHIKQFRIYDQIGQYTNLLFPFCTDTSSLTHTGSLNGSQVDSTALSLSRPVFATFYAVSHNILKFENGMASTLW